MSGLSSDFPWSADVGVCRTQFRESAWSGSRTSPFCFSTQPTMVCDNGIFERGSLIRTCTRVMPCSGSKIAAPFRPGWRNSTTVSDRLTKVSPGSRDVEKLAGGSIPSAMTRSTNVRADGNSRAAMCATRSDRTCRRTNIAIGRKVLPPLVWRLQNHRPDHPE
jgi:hypothetical protein